MLSQRSFVVIGLMLISITLPPVLFACSENIATTATPGTTKTGVHAATNKAEYKQGERIGVTLTNNSDKVILSHINSGTPVFCIEYVERKTTAGNWERSFAQCKPPDCRYDLDAPGEIRAGESATFEWEPLIYPSGTLEALPAATGLYRLSILYEDYEKTAWKSTYTGEFRIN